MVNENDHYHVYYKCDNCGDATLVNFESDKAKYKEPEYCWECGEISSKHVSITDTKLKPYTKDCNAF